MPFLVHRHPWPHCTTLVVFKLGCHTHLSRGTPCLNVYEQYWGEQKALLVPSPPHFLCPKAFNLTLEHRRAHLRSCWHFGVAAAPCGESLNCRWQTSSRKPSEWTLPTQADHWIFIGSKSSPFHLEVKWEGAALIAHCPLLALLCHPSWSLTVQKTVNDKRINYPKDVSKMWVTQNNGCFLSRPYFLRGFKVTLDQNPEGNQSQDHQNLVGSLVCL